MPGLLSRIVASGIFTLIEPGNTQSQLIASDIVVPDNLAVTVEILQVKGGIERCPALDPILQPRSDIAFIKRNAVFSGVEIKLKIQPISRLMFKNVFQPKPKTPPAKIITNVFIFSTLIEGYRPDMGIPVQFHVGYFCGLHKPDEQAIP